MDKRRIICLINPFCILIFAGLFVSAQLIAKEIKYKVADIPKELKENARSVIRNQETVFEVISISSALEKVTCAITVLNKNGIDDALLSLGYDKFSKISDIEARVYDANGEQVKKVPKDDIIDHSAISGFSIYEDSRVKFVDPKVRTIPFTIEYSYEISYSGIMSYPAWDPTDFNISVEKSSFKVLIPKNSELRYLEKNVPNKVVTSNDNKNKIYYWELKNYKALISEPYSNNLSNYFPIVIIAPSDFEIDGHKGNLTSWKNFGNWRYSLIENKNNLPEETKISIKKLVENTGNDVEKIRKIYEYMQNKTRYVNVAEGLGGWQPIDAATVDRLSYGDCKALTNYMKSLLEIVGIKSYYTVVRAGRYTRDWIVDFPYNQSNHAFLCVPLNNDTLWLECTDQRSPCGYLGTFTDDRDVLLIDKDNSKIIHTKGYSAEDNKETRVTKVKLDNTGGSATVYANYKGINYERVLPVLLADDADKKRMVTEKISLPSFQLVNFSFKENKQIIPSIEETLNISFENYGTVMGARMFVLLNFMNRYENLPERVRSRVTDVYVRRPYTEIDTVIYDLPFLYKVESLPNPVNIESQFGKYHARAELNSKKLIYIRTLQINKGKYPPAAYTDFLDFLEKISTADNLKCSLIKN
jgi:hypothetical protein